MNASQSLSPVIGRCGAAAVALALLFVSAPSVAAPGPETICDDRADNDGDTVLDCADNDCKDAPNCQPDGRDELTDARCSDWVDNDSDGITDCDDQDCYGPGITVCQGSWDASQPDATDTRKARPGALPELPDGATFEDLIGQGGDIDGERNDVLCSDGIDNDGDGAIDCADFGCRFDASVQVCRESPGIRFSVVAFITQSYDIEAEQHDTRFTTLQLRAFGPMPFIQDSFFLISMRAERTPRLTFAMFQIPIGGGHYLNINSGGGGLSTSLIRSASKQLLVRQPFYLYNAFEQGNGAALEVGGPITSDGTLDYRVFVAGGSGRFNGNVGGRFFTFDNTNFTYAFGAQLGFDLIGHISRWDTPMLYVKTPTALGGSIGFKYDQRAQERYPAMNLQLTYKSGAFIGSAETYVKRELEFENWQGAYNFTLGYLLVPKTLLIAADFGQYRATEFDNPPAVAETDIRRQNDETRARGALHWYFFRNIGVLSLVYTWANVAGRDATEPDEKEQLLELIAQYRF